ncbi:hypothetical protein ACNRWW_13890 [Metabacillus sp. HB246100]
MSGTYKDVDWTGGASKENTSATPSDVDIAKALKAGLKKPYVSKVANHQRMADAFNKLNNSKK